jgi:hypothetical protein
VDGVALQAIAETDDETMLLVHVKEEEPTESESERDTTHTSSNALYPLRPPVQSIADFKTTPLIHAGYAVTWFGLSGAGIYMTRKLITRGR